ncbi:hypothetical protein BH09PLA1_BH09PLA1_33420 [soil metagenome]
MVAFKGHFDGKVIVPDEPVNLRPNEQLLIQVQSAVKADQEEPFSFASLIGIANRAPLNPNPRITSDDELWEK